MLPLPPPHVERSAALLGEYESVARQIRQSCHQVALLDRIHSIKVPPLPFRAVSRRHYLVAFLHLLLSMFWIMQPAWVDSRMSLHSTA